MANKIAPEGCVYVCQACGKMSNDRYGFKPISMGWDESCMLNCILCHKDKLILSESGGRVVKVEDGGICAE